MGHELSCSSWSQDNPYGNQEYYRVYSLSHQYYSDEEGNPMHDEDIPYELESILTQILQNQEEEAAPLRNMTEV
ncbi:hypothetical protein HAX54_003996, partial [Datura stramonium]|nr:hypothetical protein [Datura stramonium]